MNKEPKRLLLKKSQLKELKKRIAKRNLDEPDWDILGGMADTIEFLYGVLEEKNISLRRLLKYMLGFPTESRKKILGKNTSKKDSEPDPKEPKNTSKPKGHGRR